VGEGEAGCACALGLGKEGEYQSNDDAFQR